MESEKVKEIKKSLEGVAIQNAPKIEYNRDSLTGILTLINELESENKEPKRYKLDWLISDKMHLQADMEDTEFELFCANKSLDEVRAENQQLKNRIAEKEKETAEKYSEMVTKFILELFKNARISGSQRDLLLKRNKKISKQFSVEIKE